ncbi:aminotransferase class V-fold PLP-dependent enzyme [Cognatishimia sp. MH4019]|uniref:aminotransferase class V-fold PLP-dependent enzyme n=1 Tax=Cognatishimia sp. MH4019 TaxID=2854030 RepID=UPI001CD78CF6|nr:aminotransferase class V-fold PLP-dependent enzyme [Cognatishimia sp. MH4019]
MLRQVLDTSFVRAQFPSFTEPSLRSHAFFENAGGSYMCRQVIWRFSRYFKERNVQPYGAFHASMMAGDEMDEARERLARMLGVTADELSFGPSTTQNVYVLAQAFGEWLNPGDAIVVTNQDHEANTGPWRKLAARGIEVREWEVDPETGLLELDALEPLLEGRVRLVCFPHCSNVIGAINPVKAICQRVHKAGAFACVDGVSYAPHGLPNVEKLEADIYLFSAYKTYGPHQGLMVIRRALGTALPNQAHHFNSEALYKRFTPAGPAHAEIAASAGIADYLDTLYRHHFKTGRDGAGRAESVAAVIRKHEQALMSPLLAYLETRPEWRLLGPRNAADRVPTFALKLPDDPAHAVRILSKRGIMAGSGDFYAVRPLEALGIAPDPGVLRLSFVHYTTAQEVERLIDALDHIK